MKLLMIVSGEEYANIISSILVNNDLQATEVGSSGDFLQYGNTVYLLGVHDDETKHVLSLFKDAARFGKEKPFRDEVAIYVLETDGYHKINP